MKKPANWGTIASKLKRRLLHMMPMTMPREQDYAEMVRHPGPVPPWAEDRTLLPKHPPKAAS
jgi:hypothetical protein